MYYTLMYNFDICINQLKERTMKSPFQYETIADKGILPTRSSNCGSEGNIYKRNYIPSYIWR